jgi:hypothetical protein
MIHDTLIHYFPYFVVLSVGAASNVAQLADAKWTEKYFNEPIEFVVLIAFLSLVGVFYRWIKKSVESKLSHLEVSIQKMNDEIDNIHEAMIDPHSSPIRPKLLHKAVLLEEVQSLHETIKERCGNMDCPAVKIVSSKLDSVEKDVTHRWELVVKQTEEFFADGRRSRTETLDLLNSLFIRLSTFADGVGSRMIDLVEALAEKEERVKKEHGRSGQ